MLSAKEKIKSGRDNRKCQGESRMRAVVLAAQRQRLGQQAGRLPAGSVREEGVRCGGRAAELGQGAGSAEVAAGRLRRGQQRGPSRVGLRAVISTCTLSYAGNFCRVLNNQP